MILIDAIPANGTSHTLDTLRFAPDGTLFVSNGDGESGSTADPSRSGSPGSQFLSRKILRINSDGSAPAPPQATNPFTTAPTQSDRGSGLMDCATPTASTSIRFWVTSISETLAGTPGRSWIISCPERTTDGLVFEGPLPQPDYQSTFPAQCSQLPQSATVAPIYTYDRSVGSAAVGGCFYTGGVYPAQYLNNFFYSDYTGNYISRLVLDAAGNISQNLKFATNVGVPVSMETGPDGLLYFVDFVSGNIKRVIFNGPVAQATGRAQRPVIRRSR